MWTALFDAATAAGVAVAAFSCGSDASKQPTSSSRGISTDTLSSRMRAMRTSSGRNWSRRRYVRFCEDEYEPARSGRLRRRSWAMWHPAIVEKLAGFPPHERRWIPELTKERTLRRSLVSLCAEADLASSEPHDAHDCPAFYAPLTKDGASGGLLAEASRA